MSNSPGLFSDGLNILASVQDNASQTLAGISKMLDSTASSAAKTHASFLAMGAAMATSTQLAGRGLSFLAEKWKELERVSSKNPETLKGLTESENRIAAALARMASLPFGTLSQSIRSIGDLVGRNTILWSDLVKVMGTGSSIAANSFNSMVNAAEGKLWDLRSSLNSLAATMPATFVSMAQSVGAGVIGAVDRIEATVVQRIPMILDQADVAIQGLTAAGGLLFKYSGGDNVARLAGSMSQFITPVISGISSISQKIFFVQMAAIALQQTFAAGPFKDLIQQNVQLRASLLQTQSTLAATGVVYRNSFMIQDPGSAIQSLAAPVNAAIAQIRRESLQLAGVTSEQLIEVFNIVSNSAGQVGISIKQSADLTTRFAGALTTINLPLYQARQEITSILQGTIDMNSVLAKTLGLNNQQVQQLSAQGKLYDFLVSKLEAFRVGNALVSSSFAGLTSNIQEIYQNITQVAGAPLLDALLVQLDRFYSYLGSSFDLMQKGALSIATQLAGVIPVLTEIGRMFFEIFAPVFASAAGVFFETFITGVNAVHDVLVVVQDVLGGAFQMLAVFISWAENSFTSGIVKFALTLLTLTTAVRILIPLIRVALEIMTFFGNVIFVVGLHALPLVQTFTQLTAAFQALGAAGVASQAATWLLVGQNLSLIPGAVQRIASSIPLIGEMLVPAIMAASNLGVSLVALAQKSGIAREALIGFFSVGGIGQELFSGIQQLLSAGMLDVADILSERFPKLANSLLGGAVAVDEFAYSIEGVVEALNKMGKEFAENKLAQIRSMAIMLGALAAAVGVAVVMFFELSARLEDPFANIRESLQDTTAAAEDLREALGFRAVSVDTRSSLQAVRQAALEAQSTAQLRELQSRAAQAESGYNSISLGALGGATSPLVAQLAVTQAKMDAIKQQTEVPPGGFLKETLNQARNLQIQLQQTREELEKLTRENQQSTGGLGSVGFAGTAVNPTNLDEDWVDSFTRSIRDSGPGRLLGLFKGFTTKGEEASISTRVAGFGASSTLSEYLDLAESKGINQRSPEFRRDVQQMVLALGNEMPKDITQKERLEILYQSLEGTYDSLREMLANPRFQTTSLAARQSGGLRQVAERISQFGSSLDPDGRAFSEDYSNARGALSQLKGLTAEGPVAMSAQTDAIGEQLKQALASQRAESISATSRTSIERALDQALRPSNGMISPEGLARLTNEINTAQSNATQDFIESQRGTIDQAKKNAEDQIKKIQETPGLSAEEVSAKSAPFRDIVRSAEAATEAIDKMSEGVKVAATPLLALQKALQAADTQSKQSVAEITAKEKRATAAVEDAITAQVITTQEGEEKKLQIARDSAKAQADLSANQLRMLENTYEQQVAVERASGKSEEEIQGTLAEGIQQLNQQRAKAADDRIKAAQAEAQLIESRQKRILAMAEAEMDISRRSGQLRLQYLDLESQRLEQIQRIAQARRDIVEAQNQMIEGQLAKDAQLAANTAQRDNIERALFEYKMAALQRTNEYERESLEISRQKSEIDSQRQIQQAQQQRLEAQKALLEAQSTITKRADEESRRALEINTATTERLEIERQFNAERAKGSLADPKVLGDLKQQRDLLTERITILGSMSADKARQNELDNQSLALAQESLGLSDQTIAAAQAGADQQREINQLSERALNIKQNAKIRETEMSEAARRYQTEQAKVSDHIKEANKALQASIALESTKLDILQQQTQIRQKDLELQQKIANAQESAASREVERLKMTATLRRELDFNTLLAGSERERKERELQMLGAQTGESAMDMFRRQQEMEIKAQEAKFAAQNAEVALQRLQLELQLQQNQAKLQEAQIQLQIATNQLGGQLQSALSGLGVSMSTSPTQAMAAQTGVNITPVTPAMTESSPLSSQPAAPQSATPTWTPPPPAPAGGYIPRGGGLGRAERVQSDPEGAAALIATARRLNLDPRQFAALMSWESGGTLNPNVKGGDGGAYKGLIQFSPDNQRMYGTGGQQSIAQQMPAIERYLIDRGFRPGKHDIRHAYSAILAGQASEYYWDRMDSNRTTVRNAAPKFQRGDHYERGMSFLQASGYGSMPTDVAPVSPVAPVAPVAPVTPAAAPPAPIKLSPEDEAALKAQVGDLIKGIQADMAALPATVLDDKTKTAITDAIGKVQEQLDVGVKDPEGVKQQIEVLANVQRELQVQLEKQKSLEQQRATNDAIAETSKKISDITAETAQSQQEWEAASLKVRQSQELQNAAMQQQVTILGIGVGTIAETVQSFQQSSASALKGFATGTMSLGDALRKTLSGVAEGWLDQLTKKLSTGFSSMLGNMLAGSGGVLGGKGGGKGGQAPSMLQATGSFFGIPGLATGGIVSRPTLAMIGEAGAEAVVPLTGGKLPVSWDGDVGGGSRDLMQTNNLQSGVTINIQGGRESRDAAGDYNRLGQQVEGAVMTVLRRQLQPGGMLYARS